MRRPGKAAAAGAGAPRRKARRKASASHTAIAILAAGKGTRLKSRHPKVLHQLAGKALLEHVIAAARRVARPRDIYAIIGHEAERVREGVARTGVRFVLQARQRGTGHALLVARPALERYRDVLVLSGDVPLIRPETLERLLAFHREQKAAMTMLTAELADPTGYGRVLRRRGDEVAAIVEQKSLRPEQAGIREINAGIYVFATKPLFAQLGKLTTENAHREYYLTDIAALLRAAKEKVVALKSEVPEDILGINTRAELATLDAKLRRAKCEELMAAGVTILRPETCMIDAQVRIGRDTVIEPFVQILGKSRVGSDCRIRSYSVLSDTEIGDRVLVRPGCIVDGARIGAGAVLGPYAHLRPGSDIGEEVHIGNFVETKMTRVGKGSKASHLSYLGDARIGAGVNIGAGTITCNYDGRQKHPTIIEDGAFIGSDSTLVAPLRIGKRAYVGAGSSITEDVPAEALAIARGRQVNKAGWVRKRRQAEVQTSKRR
ncbi:MAG TPA: bifunctional UDP-N-acetylglucosamine diphosphorylase/glucosamine-1-phosphate N-acetyltransferase GlmU [Terriglobales bacterium]|nr:bifunctional UDP-N-acetylglucosamine diphosphorylase/glucosamine-1-phosphate N-acetyltransferase GlmU [Terriglobales bacterium]